MTEETNWQTLIQKHLDGLTSESEASRLSEQIENNADVRSDYLKAARIHGALGDETLALEEEEEEEELETIPFPQSDSNRIQGMRTFVWPRQIAAALVAGAVVGLMGVGVVWAVNSPKSEASLVPIANGSFEDSAGPVESGFPNRFGYWSGNPAEVVQQTDGNQALRFLETGNVMGNPEGGASNCSVFQLVDLSSLRRQWEADRSESQLTLELSARFRREAAPNDAELPKLDASVRIFLFQGEPEFLSSNWPNVVREAEALGKQAIKLNPGDQAATISTSCLLNSDATLALIAVSANTRMGAKIPIKLGGYYVDDVRLTAIKQPVLPVRFKK